MAKRTAVSKNPTKASALSAPKAKTPANPAKKQGGGGKLYNYANNMVGREIQSGVNDLRKDRRKVRRETKNQMTRANVEYDRSIGDLNEVYGQTSGFIGAQNQKIADQYGANRTQSTAATAALAAQLAANNASGYNAASSELSRLGIQGSGSMDQFSADAAYSQGVAAQTGANDMANINLAASNSSSVGSLLSGMNQAALITGRGNASNARNDAMFEAEQARRDGYMQVNEAMSDVRGQRKDLVRELMQQLRASGWGKHAAAVTGGATTSNSGASSSGTSSSSSSGGTSGSTSNAPTSYYDAKADSQINALTQGYIPPAKKKRTIAPPKSKRSFTY